MTDYSGFKKGCRSGPHFASMPLLNRHRADDRFAPCGDNSGSTTMDTPRQ
jgi:hypothetical protein